MLRSRLFSPSPYSLVLALTTVAGFLPMTAAVALSGEAPATGTLVVLNKAEASASLVDLASGTELEKISTGEGPHEVAISPDGWTAVVADYGVRGTPGSTLTVIDLKRRQRSKTIELGEFHRPHGILYLGAGERVLVTAEQEQRLLLVDVESGKVVGDYATDAQISHMVAVTPGDERAFVSSIVSGSVSVFDLESGERLSNIDTGGGAEGIDVSPDGKEVWVGNRSANTLSIIDSESLEILATLECAAVPIRVKFTPDGSKALVSNAESGDLAVFDTERREELARISMAVDPVSETDQRLFGDSFGDSPVPVGICVHPAGRFAYVANTNADVITIIDLAALEIAGRLVAGREPDGLGYSPHTLGARGN